MPKHTLFILSLLMGLAACDGQPVAPVGGDTPAFNWMNNPDNGNLRIQRFQEHFATSWTDPKNGLRATHTTFPIPFMDAPETDCGPQTELTPLDVQDVGLLSDPFFLSWLHRNMKGQLWVIIRDVTQVGDCYGNKLIAEGWGNMHYTDNDLFGFVEGDKNSNAWGFGGRGLLTTPDGRNVRYNGHARFTTGTELDEDGFPIFKHADFRVNVH
jgi:hypothetical protein